MMVGTVGHRALFQRRRGCVLFVSFGVKKAANQRIPLVNGMFLVEVAGFEPTEARMQKSTSALFVSSEQGNYCVHDLQLMTANDRNFVSFLWSCVFFVSRRGRLEGARFERCDGQNLAGIRVLSLPPIGTMGIVVKHENPTR